MTDDGQWSRVVVVASGATLLRARQHLDRLLELPGIGPWSADYVLLRGLGRLDVFPPGEVGASRALGHILGRDLAAAEASAAAARFAPFQGMVYFCMLGDALTRSGDDATFQRATHAPVG